MKLSDLSQKDKLAIAEYIYSQSADILIKSDAEKVIEVFKNHNIKEAETVQVEEMAILMMINKSLDFSDKNSIMKEYYSGQL